MNKLTNCKACRKEIAKGVKKCPGCGADQRSFFGKHKIITVLGVVLIIGVLSSMGGDENSKTSSTDSSKQTTTETTAEPAKEPMVVTTDDLITALDEKCIKSI